MYTLICRIYVHLTFITIELQTEHTAIPQTKHQRFFPVWLLTTMFDTPTKAVTQAMTTLHERTTVGVQLVSSQSVAGIKLLRQVVGDIGVERTSRTSFTSIPSRSSITSFISQRCNELLA